MEIGEFIKSKRKEKGLSVRELSRRAGVSHPYLSQLETGKNKNPSIGVISKLSKISDVPVVSMIKIVTGDE